MAGNSQRKGAVRKSGSKKGASVGTGGHSRKALQGKGPTPAAKDRVGHPAARQAKREEAARRGGRARDRSGMADGDLIIGRNAVAEALDAGVPIDRIRVLDSIDVDDRVRTIIALAGKRGVTVTGANRRELDGLANSPNHQGVLANTPGFGYSDLDSIVGSAGEQGMIVALDHVTDPHNLGAIARSATAFGAAGLLVPQRRAAPVTATAWKASAGTLARLPVARIGNLVQTLQRLQREGWFVIGLDGAADHDLPDLGADLLTGKVVLVIGSEGAGLARLTAQTCDLLARIPMTAAAESLNASVAAGVALFQLQQVRASQAFSG